MDDRALTLAGMRAFIEYMKADAAKPAPTPKFYLHPYEWAQWERNGWFTHTDDGRVLSNSPYEPAGYECLVLHLIPLPC